ncbi:DNA-binding response regulator [Alicyclobacillus sp.]|uniref:DNA-binding response regulator n=1 Tax=Alicyclobacillus sp. TaxID=61169 RepID=UPI0025C568C6|nr:DNA-binding response regulator [Alicyclobacillus sp.]MCL6517768.1 DNA-binding response regulator [Alicyclobacillus sp.]
MDFATAFRSFMKHHIKEASSEKRRDRLMRGLGHSEKLFLEAVWWPAFGHFEGLYPEYEVQDYRDGIRFIDFAYLHPRFQVAIELDGYSTHARDVTPEQFSDHLMRQNTLVIDGWYVIRFATGALQHSPRQCQQVLQQLFGRLLSPQKDRLQDLRPLDREILRLFLRWPDPLGPKHIAQMLHVGGDTAARHLRSLARQRWLVPVGAGRTRVRLYRIHPDRSQRW